MSGSQDEIPPTPPPPSSSQTPTQQTPHTVSTIKLPILKKGEYDIWAMKMKHYLAHTDYPIWEVIQNGNGPVSITTDTQGQIKVLPPRTAEEILARERERKARTTLLMALPKDHLAKFHKMTDAKELWEAIKSRFGGNDESKKMQKYILKQTGGVSTEDANQKFLRSLPLVWSQVALIMRTKPGVDSLSFDDLYNNLRVFENDVKGSTASSSSTQNVAFVSENTSSTNDVSTAYGVSNPSGHNSQYEQTSSYSLLANQSSCPQLDHEDLEQLDEFDLEEMDLKWQVAMISMRMKKFYKKTGRKLQFDAKEPIGFDKTKSRVLQLRTLKALWTIDGRRVFDWTSHSEEEEDYALMACNSSDTKAYTQGLKKVEAQLVAHQKGQLWYEEKIRETVKNQFTNSKNPKVDKKGLGYGFVTKACFVCGSLSHLIRDCDFHEKRMAKQAELNNKLRKKSSQREIRPIWNNVQRVNHQNQFVPTAVLTRTGKIPVSTARASGTNNVSTARHNFNSQAVLTNAARKISTVKPFVNRVRPKTIFHKTHSPFSRPFNITTALRTNFTYQKVNTAEVNAVSAVGGRRETADYPHRALQNKGIVDSGCSRHMTGNKAYLAEYQDFNGGPVAFGRSKGYITGKGKIKIGKLDFKDVCFVKELQHFNLFSMSQICDKKNKVLFTDSECLVLSLEFKLPDANQVLLRIPRQNNMYSFNLENIVPSGGLACLIAKATIDKSNKWHKRLSHVNFKNLNKLMKENLVRGLPSKIFQNDHTCVACQKGKQHKASNGLL
ncbi:ribonuclease H-like domain-containing protein [Tanacetum coccineum]